MKNSHSLRLFAFRLFHHKLYHVKDSLLFLVWQTADLLRQDTRLSLRGVCQHITENGVSGGFQAIEQKDKFFTPWKRRASLNRRDILCGQTELFGKSILCQTEFFTALFESPADSFINHISHLISI